MDFSYLLRVLLKRKWIIIGATVLAAVVAFFVTRDEKKLYRSYSQFSTGFTSTDEVRVNPDTYNFMEADTKFNNVIVTASSPTVVSLLGYKLLLHDLTSPRPFRRLSESDLQTPLVKSVDMDKARQVLEAKWESMSLLTSYLPDEKKLLELLDLYKYDYKTISKYLAIYRLQHTDFIEVDYESENPELSAFLVNQAFQEFIRYYQSIRSERSSESIDTLRSLMEKKKLELDGKINALRQAGVVDVSSESSSKFDLIRDLQTNLEEEKNHRTKLQYSLASVNAQLEHLASQTPTTTQSSKDPSFNNEIILLARKRDDAYNAYLASGSKDEKLLKDYNDYKQQYNDKVSSLQAPAENVPAPAPGTSRDDLENKKSDISVDLASSNSNIASSQHTIDSIKSSLIASSSKGAEVESLLKEEELSNKEYLDAKQHYNDAMDQTSSAVNNFRQILLGQPAIQPEPSKKWLIVGAAGFCGFILAVLVFVILTYFDSSVKTPIIFEKAVGLKLISMINYMNLRHKKLSDLVAGTADTHDHYDKNRDNVFRELLRKLRFEIEHSGKKVFLFTSTRKGEGKTTLIQALSYSMSLSKKKILILDTNFCNNDLTVQLGASPSLEQLEGYKSDESLLETVKGAASDIVPGSVYAIGCEGGDYTPSEILPRENLLQHLGTLTKLFDYVFLEGPPLNDFSDSKELAQHVDGVIAVFSAQHIIKQIDRESIGFFKGLNGKFTGAVLNMVELENVNVV
jgi:succinoglycan biosynthesis transport protein ExoP